MQLTRWKRTCTVFSGLARAAAGSAMSASTFFTLKQWIIIAFDICNDFLFARCVTLTLAASSTSYFFRSFNISLHSFHMLSTIIQRVAMMEYSVQMFVACCCPLNASLESPNLNTISRGNSDDFQRRDTPPMKFNKESCTKDGWPHSENKSARLTKSFGTLQFWNPHITMNDCCLDIGYTSTY